jgi:hypothetical protein
LLLDPVVADDPSQPSATDVQPAIAYNLLGHRWMVNWIDYSPSFGAVLRWMELPPTGSGWQSNFMTLLGAFRAIRGLSIANSARLPNFVVALAVTNSAGGFEIVLFDLQYSYDYFSTNFQRDSFPGGGSNAGYPVVRSNPGRADYFVVWQRELPNGSWDIVGRNYVP